MKLGVLAAWSLDQRVGTIRSFVEKQRPPTFPPSSEIQAPVQWGVLSEVQGVCVLQSPQEF